MFSCGGVASASQLPVDSAGQVVIWQMASVLSK